MSEGTGIDAYLNELRRMAAAREARRVLRRGIACAVVLSVPFWALLIKGGIWLLW